MSFLFQTAVSVVRMMAGPQARDKHHTQAFTKFLKTVSDFLADCVKLLVCWNSWQLLFIIIYVTWYFVFTIYRFLLTTFNWWLIGVDIYSNVLNESTFSSKFLSVCWVIKHFWEFLHVSICSFLGSIYIRRFCWFSVLISAWKYTVLEVVLFSWTCLGHLTGITVWEKDFF